MKPIIFNTDMVRAILDGRKTQTRRPAKNPHLMLLEAGFTHKHVAPEGNYPPYQVGDVLYVRETWSKTTGISQRWPIGTIMYKADHGVTHGGLEYDLAKWRPSIHMPKWAARIFLKVKAVRLERVQDISEADAIVEGVTGYEHGADQASASMCFQALYQSIYGNVDENPWVWVIEFERIDKPI